MLPCMQLKTFLRRVHQMVRKYSRILRIWCMEGRRDHFQFHTFGRRFVYNWHLTMQGMRAWPKLSNYRSGYQNWYSINFSQDGHVYNTYPFILQPLSQCCVFLKHKVQWRPFFLHRLNGNTFYLYRQYTWYLNILCYGSLVVVLRNFARHN